MNNMSQAGSSLQEYVSSSVRRLWSRTSVEQVEVHAFTGSTKVELGENKICTPVLVRVRAPPRKQRTPVDVVAVLNISNSMESRKTQVQEAMTAVVSKLDRYDRLSLVTVDDAASVEMNLTHMHETACVTAREKIIDIVSKKSWSRNCVDKSNEYALEQVGLQIKQTASEERLRCVMLLSCGEDRLNMTEWIAKSRTDNFQFHTFDLGARHDAGRFRCLADQEHAGTYHYFANTSTITHAFAEFIGNLKTVVATSVKVSLKAEATAGFTISSVETGGHCVDNNSEHQIHIAHMHADEQKSFMVYLQRQSSASAASQEITETTVVENILSVTGKYQHGCSSSSEPKVLPCLLHGKEITMEKEVAAEVVRSMIVKEVKEIMVKEVKEVKEEIDVKKTEVQEEKKTTEEHQLIQLEEKWKEIKELAVYKEASSTQLVKHIEEDVVKMKEQGHSYMMSWLSCHWWQHATTMSHYSYAFRASSTIITTTTTTTATTATTMAARWRQPCFWVVGVLFLVLMVMLLGRFLSRRRRPLPAVMPTALDVVGKHPEWPTMVSDLDVVLGRTKEERIITFFKEKRASSHDMNQQIDQYLYMAILYAAVLRARYDGTATFSEKVVRSHAEMYIQTMLTRTRSGALPSLDVASTQAMTKAMSQYLYSTILQTEVLVTIRPPEEIIIVKPPMPRDIIEIRDETIEELQVKNESLQKENDRLREEIAKLREERDSCCKRAVDCEQKLNSNNGWGKQI